MVPSDPNLLLAATTDREILRSALDLSNEPAWKALWDQYQKPILRLCHQSGLTEAESQDVVQDAFLRLSQMMESKRLEPIQNGFRRWLGHVVHRLIFEAHRRNRRHQLGVSRYGYRPSRPPPMTVGPGSTWRGTCGRSAWRGCGP
jgi:DNA-directed RNA polymerase specialized sigma24 family protein